MAKAGAVMHVGIREATRVDAEIRARLRVGKPREIHADMRGTSLAATDLRRSRGSTEGQRSEGSNSSSGTRYDTGSAVQILGSGKLTGEERQYLTTGEQRALAGR